MWGEDVITLVGDADNRITDATLRVMARNSLFVDGAGNIRLFAYYGAKIQDLPEAISE